MVAVNEFICYKSLLGLELKLFEIETLDFLINYLFLDFFPLCKSLFESTPTPWWTLLLVLGKNCVSQLTFRRLGLELNLAQFGLAWHHQTDNRLLVVIPVIPRSLGFSLTPTLTILLATLRRWRTVPHRFAARHSLGAHRAALQMSHYVRVA